MSLHETFGQPLLTFPDAEKSPLSIRAKALVFVDPARANYATIWNCSRHAPCPC